MTELGSRRKIADSRRRMADKSGMVLDEGIDLVLMDPCCQGIASLVASLSSDR